jgi:hypothetical protein
LRSLKARVHVYMDLLFVSSPFEAGIQIPR